MKRLFQLMFVAMPLINLAQENIHKEGIRWVNGLTWDQIRQKAKEENKFVFVDAYTTWCGPCKMMDKEVYSDEKVGDETNTRFLSVKVQMDKTENDPEEIKAWYANARSLKETYVVNEFPTYLFFSPDGKLVHRGIGFRASNDFISLVKEALTDPNTRYEKAINQFKKGQLKFEEMPQLARDAWDRKDRDISIAIVKEYKEGYADKLEDATAFTQANLSILGEFSNEVLSSRDRYFMFFQGHGQEADSIVNRIVNGKLHPFSRNVVLGIVRKEEISDKLYSHGKPVANMKPKWNKIHNSIRKKYGSQYADFFFPNEQIRFYELNKDWNNYVKCVNYKIKKIPPQAGGKKFGSVFSDAWQLNSYAWTVFEHCSDKNILESALSWVDLSLKLAEKDYVVDTKANLLYKLGRVSEAITLQEKAVILSKNSKSTIATLQKMKEGLPTWPPL